MVRGGGHGPEVRDRRAPRYSGESSLDIIRVIETPNHAGHVFRHGRLAEATGARIDISKDVDVKDESELLSAFYEAFMSFGLAKPVPVVRGCRLSPRSR